MSLPSLLLVPGAWHCTQHFQLLIDQLKQLGFDCHAVDLPSMLNYSTVTSIAADTECVRDNALEILDHSACENVSRDLILVMHSYAGAPTSNALDGLLKADRTKAGYQNGVIGLISIAALIVDEGESIATSLTGDSEDWMNTPWKKVDVSISQLPHPTNANANGG
jgi:hypothetical protein